ncbi:TlyA family RNA methyltransferase [Galbitalea sp. SE-J8]|uniref:TlyA family RNA methyltransferase n=1 Tax=Galbitalea sp. SE-J8 TaxID=3054952 RepID=UPI00259CB6EC|nr:TlyA family RNA methyltransferase [Galbitalea sp. SE-J8]MDM4764311.1 TlyA family RNA methyltransferase [Galbitalea sp. SE-J8]
MPTTRLDAALVARGLAPSRTRAARLIADGEVAVAGLIRVKASTPVTDAHEISVASANAWVGRAARKLDAALGAFAVDPRGRLALDVGASTGGFTQVLLERGARRVIALDVGHDQLVSALRADPRVVVVEGFNARELDAASLARASGLDEVPSLAVVDVSFIPLRLVLPALRMAIAADADVIALVKPQFEVGRGGIREGVVRDAALRADAVRGVLATAAAIGLRTAGVLSSPIEGSAGNREVLVHLSAVRGSDPTEWEARVIDSTR